MTTTSDLARPHRTRVLEACAAIAVATLAVAWNLDAKWIVGDELNAINFLREGFLDYMGSFHYGPAIKAQVWAIHHFFGNDFGWYRVPAALAAVLTCGFLFMPTPASRPRWDCSGLAIVFLLAFNAAFLYFARWGMPSYAQGIAACTLLLGLVLRDLQRGPDVRWSPGKLVLVCLLPWMYPATIVLLGGITVYLGLALVPRLLARRDLRDIAPHALKAAVPLLLGVANLGINIAMRSVEDWERAREHHLTFTEWAARTGGGWARFLGDGLSGLFADIDTGAVVGGGGIEAFFEAGYAAVLSLAGVMILVASCLILWIRSRADAPDQAQGTLRAMGLLLTVLASTILVTFLTSLVDAFPIGSIRYVFHLFPTLAFLAIFSLALTGWAVERAWPRAWAAMALAIAVTVLVLSAAGIRSLAAQRATAESKEAALLSALQSGRNLAIVSWDPGFFLPAALFPDAAGFFHVGAERRIPTDLATLVYGASAAHTSTDAAHDLVFFAKSGQLIDASGNLQEAVAAFTDRAGYEMAKRIQGRKHEVVVFAPRVGAVAASRDIDAELVLPPGPILSIRIEPTDLRQAGVLISRLVLEAGGTTSDVDLCGDLRLQLVRTAKLRRTDDGCMFRFGNEKGSGWIAPTLLRNLPATGTPRRLRIAAAGELGLQAKIYLDLGQGYRSRDMLSVNVSPPAPQHPASEGGSDRQALSGKQ